MTVSLRHCHIHTHTNGQQTAKRCATLSPMRANQTVETVIYLIKLCSFECLPSPAADFSLIQRMCPRACVCVCMEGASPDGVK